MNCFILAATALLDVALRGSDLPLLPPAALSSRSLLKEIGFGSIQKHSRTIVNAPAISAYLTCSIQIARTRDSRVMATHNRHRVWSR